MDDDETRTNGASDDDQSLQDSDDDGNLDQQELDEETRDLFGEDDEEPRGEARCVSQYSSTLILLSDLNTDSYQSRQK